LLVVDGDVALEGARGLRHRRRFAGRYDFAYFWGTQRAIAWEEYSLDGVTEEDVNTSGDAITMWKGAAASVPFITYTVQPGDTMAKIRSTYPQPWRIEDPRGAILTDQAVLTIPKNGDLVLKRFDPIGLTIRFTDQLQWL